MGQNIDHTEAERKIRKILSEKTDFPIEKITPETSLIKELGIDSFGAIELMFSLKDECGVEITQEEISKFNTVKDIIDRIIKSSAERTK
jgi:acyl carrier protein